MLAPGLDRAECRGQRLPRAADRRFARAVALVGRAESAADPAKARRKLRRVARLLGEADNGVARFAPRHHVATDCSSAVSAMLADGARRALELAMSP